MDTLRTNVPWIVSFVAVLISITQVGSCNAYASTGRVDRVETRLGEFEKRIDEKLDRIIFELMVKP